MNFFTTTVPGETRIGISVHNDETLEAARLFLAEERDHYRHNRIFAESALGFSVETVTGIITYIIYL